MCDVITHPRFARAPVPQPHKRRRKGTISFAVAKRRKEMDAYFADDNAPRHGKPATSSRLDLPMSTERDWIPVKVHGDINAFRLFKALQSEGLTFTDGHIFEWPTDGDVS